MSCLESQKHTQKMSTVVQWFISDVDLALEYLQCVEVGCVADVSEEYAGSIFCIRVGRSCYVGWW